MSHFDEVFMYGAPNPAAGVDTTLWYILVISIVLLTLITVTMIWFVIRYRRDKHPEPADIRGNWFLESVWMLLPTLSAICSTTGSNHGA